VNALKTENLYNAIDACLPDRYPNV
jgi:hypothetical protein